MESEFCFAYYSTICSIILLQISFYFLHLDDRARRKLSRAQIESRRLLILCATNGAELQENKKREKKEEEEEKFEDEAERPGDLGQLMKVCATKLDSSGFRTIQLFAGASPPGSGPSGAPNRPHWARGASERVEMELDERQGRLHACVYLVPGELGGGEWATDCFRFLFAFSKLIWRHRTRILLVRERQFEGQEEEEEFELFSKKLDRLLKIGTGEGGATLHRVVPVAVAAAATGQHWAHLAVGSRLAKFLECLGVLPFANGTNCSRCCKPIGACAGASARCQRAEEEELREEIVGQIEALVLLERSPK